MSLEEALEREMDLMNDGCTAAEPSVPKSTDVNQSLDVTSHLEQRKLDIQMNTDAPPVTANVPGDSTGDSTTPTDQKPPTDVVSQAEHQESGLQVTETETIPASVPSMETPAQFVDTGDSAAKESEVDPKPSPTDPPSTSEVKDLPAPASMCQPSISLKFTDAELLELRRSKVEESTDAYLFALCDFLKQHEQFPAFLEHMKSELGETDFHENWMFGDDAGDPLEDVCDFLEWFRKKCGVAEPAESAVDDSSSHRHSDFEAEAESDEGSSSRFKYKGPPSKDHPDINNLLDSAAKAGHDKFSVESWIHFGLCFKFQVQFSIIQFNRQFFLRYCWTTECKL